MTRPDPTLSPEVAAYSEAVRRVAVAASERDRLRSAAESWETTVNDLDRYADKLRAAALAADPSGLAAWEAGRK